VCGPSCSLLHARPRIYHSPARTRAQAYETAAAFDILFERPEAQQLVTVTVGDGSDGVGCRPPVARCCCCGSSSCLESGGKGGDGGGELGSSTGAAAFFTIRCDSEALLADPVTKPGVQSVGSWRQGPALACPACGPRRPRLVILAGPGQKNGVQNMKD
jgi:hypothetical protein